MTNIETAVAAILPDERGSVSSGQRIVAVRQYTMRLVEDLGALPGAAPSFRGKIGGQTVLELESSDGWRGIAPGIDPASLRFARDHLVGETIFPLSKHIALLENPGSGASGRDVASIEIALWDIVGQSLGQPLFRLWGGDDPKVLGYGSTIGRGASVEERVDLARLIFAEGWKAIKLRPHWETVADDIRLVSDVRQATSSEFVILCDANQARGQNLSGISWDLERASQTAEAYHELSVGWLEEPLKRGAYRELAALSTRSKVPLAGGENNVILDDFRNYAVNSCYSYWQPEVMLVGPSRMFKIAALAEAFNVKFVPHEGYQSLGTVCQIHISAALKSPYVEILHNPPVSTFENSMFCYADAPVLTKDGYIQLSGKPGLGVSLRRDLIDTEH
ncbi:MAG TPA: mandelate racemase/muconate lactonizing enzyme family protein [Sphingobium sp.]|nr:mandelate racemase/muconate lactonizing enzyme family protein [Sphingobium sp.]